MNSQVRIRRSRGAVCGAALILLGLWGGLAPFVGPYFHFGFSPDKAFGYTTGRLYLSAIPGAVALAGGIAVTITRSRIIALAGGILASIGGAWFVAGSGITLYLLKQTSISAGVPLGYSASSGPYTVRAYLEVLALFGGVGALIIFAAALACGRVSMLSARDVADDADATYYPDYDATSGDQPDSGGYPAAGTGQFPTVTRFPGTAADPFSGPTTGQFPTAAGQFPAPSEQYTRPSSLPPRVPPFPNAPKPSTPEMPTE
jgi:hypothetical protein